MARPEEVAAFVADAAGRELPEMTPGAAARLRPFDLGPLRAAGPTRAAILATAFCDAALATRGLRLALLAAPATLRGEVADPRLNEGDMAVAMAATAARAAEMVQRAGPGVAPDPLLSAFADCDCWPF